MIAAAVAIALAFQSVGGVSPNSLRKHVEFLASDKLEGRDTPSAGLDLAAAYIAGEFKARAGRVPTFLNRMIGPR